MNSEEIEINSPLTNGKVIIINEFSTSDIIHSYQSDLCISVDEYLNNHESIKLFQCRDSGYEFYYPFGIEGKEKFYYQLAKFHWYYNPWKWEHEQSINFICRSNSILEIGCGSGGFIKNLKNRFPQKKIYGLEITVTKETENFILNETIQQHVASSINKYDLVCSYQVLEHVADVFSFLQASVDALRVNGYLIISVPNNDGLLLRKKGSSLLNFPPHHMGLWNKRSLTYLTKLFPLKFVKAYYEPIQDYHFDWFRNIIKKRLRSYNFPFILSITSNRKLINLIATALRPFYHGHTIMFVYQKK